MDLRIQVIVHSYAVVLYYVMQVLRFRCTNEARCEGLGDRFVGLNQAFWLVLPL
jgi:hypothetical protein